MMVRDGYAKLHPVGIDVRADMLETVAGYRDEATIDKELDFALASMDRSDPDTMRWVASLLAMKIDYVESRQSA